MFAYSSNNAAYIRLWVCFNIQREPQPNNTLLSCKMNLTFQMLSGIIKDVVISRDPGGGRDALGDVN